MQNLFGQHQLGPGLISHHASIAMAHLALSFSFFSFYFYSSKRKLMFMSYDPFYLCDALCVTQSILISFSLVTFVPT
jgi:hypothetical protein